EHIIADELIGRAVQAIGTAPQRDVDRGAGAVPLLGVEARGLDLEFLHGVGRWDKGDAVTTTTVVVRVGYAVERELVPADARDTVRDEVRTPVVVEGPREFQVTDVPDAGRETRQSERVAVRQRQFRNAPPVNHLPRRA